MTKSENAGNAAAELAKTTLEYAPDQADQARRLADIMGLSGSALKPGKSVDQLPGPAHDDADPRQGLQGRRASSLTTPTKAPEGVQQVHGGQGRVRQVTGDLRGLSCV